MDTAKSFRPHDGGSFFNNNDNNTIKVSTFVFVPMMGDLFLILHIACKGIRLGRVFVPMMGDLFLISSCQKNGLLMPVFVPMMGDLFLILCPGSPMEPGPAVRFAAQIGFRLDFSRMQVFHR